MVDETEKKEDYTENEEIDETGSIEEDSEEKNEDEKKGGLRYAPWIGAGFGLIASGYIAVYFLRLFSSMERMISPSVGNLLITIGIIVLVVALTAEIIAAFRENK